LTVQIDAYNSHLGLLRPERCTLDTAQFTRTAVRPTPLCHQLQPKPNLPRTGDRMNDAGLWKGSRSRRSEKQRVSVRPTKYDLRKMLELGEIRIKDFFYCRNGPPTESQKPRAILRQFSIHYS
jgi:hypothetical protein